jgi:hypothetical protein
VRGSAQLSEFTGTFPAVLTFSVLLAILCLFSITRATRSASGAARTAANHPAV